MAKTAKITVAVPSFAADAQACARAWSSAGRKVSAAFQHYVDALASLPRTEDVCKAAQARMIEDAKPYVENGTLPRSSMYNYIKAAIVAHALGREFNPSVLNEGKLAWVNGAPVLQPKEAKPKADTAKDTSAAPPPPVQPIKANVQVTLSGIEAHIIDLWRRGKYHDIEAIVADAAK